ncbi:MAG: site-specific DNA-methyltransferase [Cetobacterium sp.]|nr:site-specific DNA-methyltransferase [Cetobacterium sp.]
MENLILTYSKEGDTILDFCMGSGTIGSAAIKNNRNYIGIEQDIKIYAQALERLQKNEK